MDNASDDGTSEMCQMLEVQHPGVVRHIRLKRNIGTNAYALGFLQAHYKYLVCMDDDVWPCRADGTGRRSTLSSGFRVLDFSP